jgi:hypothetical protein
MVADIATDYCARGALIAYRGERVTEPSKPTSWSQMIDEFQHDWPEGVELAGVVEEDLMPDGRIETRLELRKPGDAFSPIECNVVAVDNKIIEFSAKVAMPI